MTMNRQGRPTHQDGATSSNGAKSGSALIQEEPLLFEISTPGACGVDVPDAPQVTARLGHLKRDEAIGLPQLSEPSIVRHFTRLSQQNYSIDTGFYPLGSCTMKHNPRLNEKVARFAGFAALHPLAPLESCEGAFDVMRELGMWLGELCNLPAVSLIPAAGAHGELCGLMTIRAALVANGNPRSVVVIPESAHGTNPATASMCQYQTRTIPADTRGRVDLAALKASLDDEVAAVMITNPNTCGLFENDMIEIGKAVRANGSYLYCDGANFNALVGRVCPGDLGIDVMHINLHKTFSTPHGGGGPGSGPTVFSARLAPFAPRPLVLKKEGQWVLNLENDPALGHVGRMKAFYGQFTTFVRALAYILSHGADGLFQVSGDAVLNANYILAMLKNDLTPSFDGPCMHEALFDERFLKGTDLTTLDIAKALIDEGFHPMTMYFPLVVKGALLIEPTETETKANLDNFIAAMKRIVAKAKGSAEDVASLKSAPQRAPRSRANESLAARQPKLVADR